MYYTLAFYIILALLCFNIRDRKKAMSAAFTFAAIYMSLRYNYPSDYPAYHHFFEMCNRGDYQYTKGAHMEYGWYLLCRLFAPFGYYAFVAFCSCIFACGLYVITMAIVPKVYFPIVALGLFAMGNFEVLMSAQRQMLVAGIFLIAYRYLVYQRMTGWRDLFHKRTLLYFTVIVLCFYFHKSALFYLIIPFFYLFPSRSILVLVGVAVSAVFLYFYGELYLVDVFEKLQDQTGEYDYMEFASMTVGASTLQIAMWVFQFICVAIVYVRYSYDTDKKVVMLVSMLSTLIVISGYSLGQFSRLSHFIYMFSFLTISIIAERFNRTAFGHIYLAINWVWIIWNMAKIFSIPRGTLYEYKLLLLNL